MTSEKTELRFDFPEVQVATIESEYLDTGMTLFRFPPGTQAACDIRGGAAAVRESSSIDELNEFGEADALVLAGGSTYGLEAASGVMQEILKERRGSSVFQDIPCVPSAIVYDFRERHESHVFPDVAMGRKAYAKLQRSQISIGRAGAGANVFVGKLSENLKRERGGQGAAFIDVGGVKILAVSVVNALGNILDLNGQVIRGSYDEKSNRRWTLSEINQRNTLSWQNPDAQSDQSSQKGNTTISAIITNLAMDRKSLKRLAVMAHTSMARVIEPFHTPWDGDVLFAVSTGSIQSAIPSVQLGSLATEIMQKAVLSVFQDQSLKDIHP